MLIFLGVLIMLASVLLGIVVLIQNPKGGGLSGTFGGFNNQIMGVRQTTDVLEKGTWTLAIIIGALCLASAFFIPKQGSNGQQINAAEKAIGNMSTTPSQQPATFPTNQNSQPLAPAGNSSGNKK
jgi:preprotein translocase subunit SecG